MPHLRSSTLVLLGSLLAACGSSSSTADGGVGDAAHGAGKGKVDGSSSSKDGAPPFDSPSVDAPSFEAPSFDAPPAPFDANLAAVGGLGAASFAAGDLDAPSHGGTITFQQIGATGWYPSVRDPATGPCNASDSGTCCLAEETISSDQLTPWDEELTLTLRGPMVVKQLAVYQPATNGTTWDLVSGWDDRSPTTFADMAFTGNATPNSNFSGGVGSECQLNVATDEPFPCGPGSSPYCAAGSQASTYGWAGSKLFIVLAKMAHAGTSGAPTACSTTTTGNWYDAPWMGLSVGELARAGAYASCQCFAKDPAKWWLADGCGQFNVFEVVNDNDSSKNLDVFSTDLIDYSGYVGQGPCGSACNTASLGGAVDLIDKTNDTEATAGALASPAGGPTAALRRPEDGYRYFIVMLDVASRTIQLALVHPERIPTSIAPILPALPSSVPNAAAAAVLALRLPQ